MIHAAVERDGMVGRNWCVTAFSAGKWRKVRSRDCWMLYVEAEA